MVLTIFMYFPSEGIFFVDQNDIQVVAARLWLFEKTHSINFTSTPIGEAFPYLSKWEMR